MNLTIHAQKRLELAEKICRIKGARLTEKRRQVFTLLLLCDKAISAYDLVELFKEKFKEELQPMTAYRNLDFLEKVQLVHKLNTANKYVACSHVGCSSSHVLPHFLICQKCSRVDELNNSSTNILSNLKSKAQQTGYKLSSPQIELNGICNDCL